MSDSLQIMSHEEAPQDRSDGGNSSAERPMLVLQVNDDVDDLELLPQQGKRRTSAGRTARRRRRRLQEIQRVEQSLMTLEGGTTTATTTINTMTMMTDHSNNNNKSGVLPGDRSYVWPAVVQRRKESGWRDDEDGPALQRQLGYLPGNVIRIAARWHDLPVGLLGQGNVPENEPVVAHLYPIVLRDEHSGRKNGFRARKRIRGENNRVEHTASSISKSKDPEARTDCDHDSSETSCAMISNVEDQQSQLIEPFPTSYWLTHPLLHHWVSQLEVEGFGRTLEERLRRANEQDHQETLKQMMQTHQSYGQERWLLLTDTDRQSMMNRGWTEALQTGVAGNHYNRANKKDQFSALSVKCLHAHTAHRLAGHDNRIGQWVLDELIQRAPSRTKAGNAGTTSTTTSAATITATAATPIAVPSAAGP